jgi:type III secretory pathway component EscS
MNDFFLNPCCHLSDAILFPLIQKALVLFALFAFLFNSWKTRKISNEGFSAKITRGDQSMKLFYGMYAAISGLLIAICLSVDMARNYRILWVVVDTGIVAYLCLFNPWFRNLIIKWANQLSKIEKR